MSHVTINDVAQEAGLSPSSVSRILRGGKGHVYSGATVERVQRIARDLGYRPNAAARMLSRGVQSMIGIPVHFTEHPYLNRFYSAVHRELLKHEFDPVLIDAEQLTREDGTQPFPPPHMLSGLISMGIDLQQGWPRHYARLAEDVPIVALQPVSKAAAAHVHVVQVDSRSAYLQAFDHLISLGHRNIAYLGVVRKPFPTDSSKVEGWKAAARHFKCSTQYVISWAEDQMAAVDAFGHHSDFLYQPETTRNILEVVEQLRAFDKPISAIMCGSDEVAIALQSHLQAEGWKLPQTLSVIGYDGISLGNYVLPTLTTIAPDYDRMAELAVARLVELIAAQKARAHADSSNHARAQTARQNISIEPHLVIRSSTAPLAA